jgi:hypothetical protein
LTSLPFSWGLRAAAYMLAAAYFGFALLHVYWAMGGRRGGAAAVPREDGQPTLRPGRLATFAVAFALVVCAALLLCWLDVLPLIAPRGFVRTGIGLLATVMLLRAIGDFRYIGLFKTRGDGPFRRMDTMLYTPLCIIFSVVLWALAIAD